MWNRVSEDLKRWRPYLEQKAFWPEKGKHILADFDDESIVVYQAYRHSIAKYALENQKFGGDFSLNRMTWIKPNFLWMMYRSGWGTKEGQEYILSIRIRRAFFDEIIETAVPSTFSASGFSSQDDWRHVVAASDVRLQWDPDHDPFGQKVERRAIQLGLRGDTIRRYGTEEIISITDISKLVADQRKNLSGDLSDLMVPIEHIYRSF